MNISLASTRAEQLSPFIVMEVLEKAQSMKAQGEDIIHLEVGEPDFATPTPVKEAALRAIQNNDTHYTHSLGKLSLREEIAHYYFRKYGVEISPEQVLVTSGTSPGMLLVFSVLLEKGEEIILPDPYYACYPNFIRFVNGNPVCVPVSEAGGFKYSPEDIKQHLSPLTRAIMVNSPSNPTGSVCSASELKDLADLGQIIIADEIYNGLIYEGEEHTILEFTDRAFVINGFSKLFAMTGWRLGYVIAPREYIRAMQIMQQNFFICASSFAQEGGIAALRDCEKDVKSMVNIYNERRRYLLGRLKEMGIATSHDPSGAFYALGNVKRYTNNSYQFAFEILEQAKVAVTPGIDFGANCEGYIRFSYANSLDNIKEGMNRLEHFLMSK
ncbi:Pyridoxal phosphate-dependent transferase [Syntrophomonas zehnderi OL-4]|uniref:Aminotransferase n=1 Tax=Syntrophomonas zehnderi OL-4 TaxID=690567 RepID=A0A0E4GDA3_9FIRM|nr:pyridoxal phosphate-dependent aminotransferase [Syntrophomonas zehnderi]CFX40828.1 Pyridoxal phosphate-dependent transferase [Syntrophomonas zehnderi OL-4]